MIPENELEKRCGKSHFPQTKKRYVSGNAYIPLSFCLLHAYLSAYIAAYIEVPKRPF